MFAVLSVARISSFGSRAFFYTFKEDCNNKMERNETTLMLFVALSIVFSIVSSFSLSLLISLSPRMNSE